MRSSQNLLSHGLCPSSRWGAWENSMKSPRRRYFWPPMTPVLSRAPSYSLMVAERKSKGDGGKKKYRVRGRGRVVSDDPAILASYRSKDAIDFYLQPTPPGIWENSVTIRSTRAARMYEPGSGCLAYLLHPC